MLRLDPANPLVKDGRLFISKGKSSDKDDELGEGVLSLHPWQVIGIAWLDLMLTSPLRGALLAYDMVLIRRSSVLC